VPEGTARLRLSLSAELSEKMLADFAADLDIFIVKRAA
jgi:7-keto-8-aminopelargonate synthetase-like enzyme